MHEEMEENDIVSHYASPYLATDPIDSGFHTFYSTSRRHPLAKCYKSFQLNSFSKCIQIILSATYRNLFGACELLSLHLIHTTCLEEELVLRNMHTFIYLEMAISVPENRVWECLFRMMAGKGHENELRYRVTTITIEFAICSVARYTSSHTQTYGVKFRAALKIYFQVGWKWERREEDEGGVSPEIS